MALAALIALLCLANLFLRRPLLPLYGGLALIAVSFLGGWAYPAAVQSLTVEPSEFNFEKEYLAHNMFHPVGLRPDSFTTRQYPAGKELTWNDLQENLARSIMCVSGTTAH